MWVQLTNIPSAQSKHRYGKLTFGHLYVVSTSVLCTWGIVHILACNVKNLSAYLHVKWMEGKRKMIMDRVWPRLEASHSLALLTNLEVWRQMFRLINWVCASSDLWNGSLYNHVGSLCRLVDVDGKRLTLCLFILYMIRSQVWLLPGKSSTQYRWLNQI